MPLLKGASSEYTTFIKYNAMTLPATAVRARSTISLPGISIVGTLTKASTIAARSSPRSSVLQTYNTTPAEPAEVAVTIYLPASVGADAFIVKYSLSGAVQWATRISGTLSDLGRGMTTDSTGVYVTGRYTSASEVTLNNDIKLPITAGTPPGDEVFIVKYNTNGVAQWATRISGTSIDQGNSITTDATGVYVTGYYTSTSEVTLNNEKILPISVGTDAFIVKYNTSGVAQWATTISGASSDNGLGITTDATGVYVTGNYTSGSGATLNNEKILPNSLSADTFIVKYNTSGLAQWATTIRGTGADGGNGITTDATGVYVTGYYNSASEVTLNNDIKLPITAAASPSAAPSQDAFIVKYDTSGLAQWATTIRGTVSDQGNGITTDATGVYVTGYYNSASEVTLNNDIKLPITAAASPSAAPGSDAFIVKYNTSGLAQWATTIRGTGFDTGNGITTDSTGVYVTGYYTAAAEIILNNGKTLPITAAASPSAAPGSDAFIVKYNTSGLAQSVTTIRGTGFDTGNGITTDSTGVYVTGYYTSSDQILLTNGS
jgi:hypothetical protein